MQPLPAILGSLIPIPPPLPVIPISATSTPPTLPPTLPPIPPTSTSTLPPVPSLTYPPILPTTLPLITRPSIPPTPFPPSCPPVHQPSLCPTSTVAGSPTRATQTEPAVFTLALATIALPAPITVPVTPARQLPCNLCKTPTSSPAFPIDNTCIPLQPREWYSMFGNADNDPVDLEYTINHPTPHRLSLVDLGRDMKLKVYIDGVLSRSTSGNLTFHGDDLGGCRSIGFYLNNFIVPSGDHTVKVAWVGNAYSPDTEQMSWDGPPGRQLMWKLDLCT